MITTVQLNEALKAQKTFGRRLGTNLIEFGYISEQSLATFLAVQLKLPAAGVGDLDAISKTVLELATRSCREMPNRAADGQWQEAFGRDC